MHQLKFEDVFSLTHQGRRYYLPAYLIVAILFIASLVTARAPPSGG